MVAAAALPSTPLAINSADLSMSWAQVLRDPGAPKTQDAGTDSASGVARFIPRHCFAGRRFCSCWLSQFSAASFPLHDKCLLAAPTSSLSALQPHPETRMSGYKNTLVSWGSLAPNSKPVIATQGGSAEPVKRVLCILNPGAPLPQGNGPLKQIVNH